MDAAWALPESPYDLLGIDDDCELTRILCNHYFCGVTYQKTSPSINTVS